MTTHKFIQAPVFWTLGILTLLINGALAILSLSELYSIISNEAADYPFGGEGPAPYYYKTANTYATVMLLLGLVYLMTFILAVSTKINRQERKTVFIFAMTIFLVLLMFLNAQMGAEWKFYVFCEA